MTFSLDPQAFAAWLQRLEGTRHLTPARAAWAVGYAQALEALHPDFETFLANLEAQLELEPERFPGEHERLALERKRHAKERWKKERQRKEIETDYRGLREALDAAPPEFHMTRPMAQFYLHLSPAAFTKALKRGPHPFAEPRGGATKGAIDAWHPEAVLAEHGVPGRKVHSRTRQAWGGFVLVAEGGLILSEGRCELVPGYEVAKQLRKGARVRRMSLAKALASPWAEREARKPWADLRQQMLQQKVERGQDEARRLRAALEAAKKREQPSERSNAEAERLRTALEAANATIVRWQAEAANARAQDMDAAFPAPAPTRRKGGSGL